MRYKLEALSWVRRPISTTRSIAPFVISISNEYNHVPEGIEKPLEANHEYII